MNTENQKTILLVEDELLVALNQKQTLERHGFRVITAKNGESALEIAEISPDIDLVLMDICLGEGIDGAEAAEHIISKRELPLIFLSSHVEPEVVGKTDGIRSYGYIVKSSGETVLLTTVRMALNLYDKIVDEQEKCREAKQREEKFNLIFEKSPEAIMFMSTDGRVFEANPAACRILNRPVEEICELGRKCFLDLSDPQIVKAIEERDLTGIFSGELHFLKSDGTLVPVDVISAAFEDNEGELKSSVFFRDITARRKAEQKIHALLREKEILLKEIHHRIKNNMHTIYSLLALQANTQDDAAVKGILNNAANRVQSMVVLYDKLYSSSVYNSLNIRDYLLPLINEIVGVFFKFPPVKTIIEIEDFMLSTRILSPIGIIINELITNSMKYAFHDAELGQITVSAVKNGKLVTLVYEDNGPGLPESVIPEDSSTFGFTVINLLVEQINGTIASEKGKGVRFVITFEA